MRYSIAESRFDAIDIDRFGGLQRGVIKRIGRDEELDRPAADHETFATPNGWPGRPRQKIQDRRERNDAVRYTRQKDGNVEVERHERFDMPERRHRPANGISPDDPGRLHLVQHGERLAQRYRICHTPSPPVRPGLQTD